MAKVELDGKRSGSKKGSSHHAMDAATAARTLTRADIADALHRKIGVSRVDSAKYVEMFLEEIFERIVAREDVKLSSFGAFIVRAKKQRLGRNPKTGADATISARLVVTFKPSNVLRARINNIQLPPKAEEARPRRAAAQIS